MIKLVDVFASYSGTPRVLGQGNPLRAGRIAPDNNRNSTTRVVRLVARSSFITLGSRGLGLQPMQPAQ